jgi:hypothetical protein
MAIACRDVFARASEGIKPADAASAPVKTERRLIMRRDGE